MSSRGANEIASGIANGAAHDVLPPAISRDLARARAHAGKKSFYGVVRIFCACGAAIIG